MEEQYKDIRDLVKEAGVEHPSPDFLRKVMDKVERCLPLQNPESYKLLIFSKGWRKLIF